MPCGKAVVSNWQNPFNHSLMKSHHCLNWTQRTLFTRRREEKKGMQKQKGGSVGPREQHTIFFVSCPALRIGWLLSLVTDTWEDYCQTAIQMERSGGETGKSCHPDFFYLMARDSRVSREH